jgi:hypothetical protein
MVLSEVGPVQIAVARNRDGSFEPQIVRKRQRRLSGVEDMVLPLSARGLTTGEISAHLVEVYGAEVSRQTISTITDKVLEAWPSGRTGLSTRGGFYLSLRILNGRLSDAEVFPTRCLRRSSVATSSSPARPRR